MIKRFTLCAAISLFFVLVHSQIIVTKAGNGVGGYNGDSRLASTAQVNEPIGLHVDKAGNIFFTDYQNYRIRRIDALTDTITTVAGDGIRGHTGDGHAATSAELDRPNGVWVDTAENIYIADGDNNCIRMVNAATGNISTVAGTTVQGFFGDGGQATSAELNGTYGVAVDDTGNIYIADYNNNRVRKVTIATGIINTIAGTGTPGYNGDNIRASTAELYNPYGLWIDKYNNIFIADRSNNRVRKIDTLGIIHTVAGTGAAGYNGDGMAADSAKLSSPLGITTDSAGNIYIGDEGNQRIRKIDAVTGHISTIAGTGTPGYNGEGIAATTAELNDPGGVGVDVLGNVYFAEYANSRVREIVYNDSVHVSVAATAMAVCTGSPITFIASVVNGGANPVYEWMINGVAMGPDSSSFTTAALSDHDTVTCTVISSLPGVSDSIATSIPIIVSVTPIDTVTDSIAASATAICPGVPVVFTAFTTNGGSAPTYQWMVNNVPVGGDSSIYISSTPNNNDTVVCIFSSNLGCSVNSVDTSNPIVIAVGVSAFAGNISASLNPLCLGRPDTLFVTGSIDSLQWQFSSTGTLFNNIIYTTDSIYPLDTPQSGYYRVVAGSGFCADTSVPYLLIVHPSPEIPLISCPDSTICPSDSAQIQSTTGFASYLWNNSDSTAAIYTNLAGSYQVTVTDTNGCTATSGVINISVYPVPQVAVNVRGDTLSSGSASYYQWYLNDSIIPGATSAVYIARQSGDYAVQITDSNGCKAISNAQTVVLSGISETGGQNYFSIYPNPVTDVLNIWLNGIKTGIFEFSVYDALGQQVILQQRQIENLQIIKIDLSSLSTGTYLLQFKSESALFTAKVEKR